MLFDTFWIFSDRDFYDISWIYINNNPKSLAPEIEAVTLARFSSGSA